MRQVLEAASSTLALETAGNQPSADGSMCCLLLCFLQRTCMRLGSWRGSASPASWHLKVGQRTFFPGRRAFSTRALRYSLIFETAMTCCSSHRQCTVQGNDCLEPLSGCAGLHYGEVFEQVALLQCRPPIPLEMPTDYAGARANRLAPARRHACTVAHLLVPARQQTVSEDAVSHKDIYVLFVHC